MVLFEVVSFWLAFFIGLAYVVRWLVVKQIRKRRNREIQEAVGGQDQPLDSAGNVQESLPSAEGGGDEAKQNEAVDKIESVSPGSEAVKESKSRVEGDSSDESDGDDPFA